MITTNYSCRISYLSLSTEQERPGRKDEASDRTDGDQEGHKGGPDIVYCRQALSRGQPIGGSTRKQQRQRPKNQEPSHDDHGG
jgi:hypothetical protein